MVKKAIVPASRPPTPVPTAPRSTGHRRRSEVSSSKTPSLTSLDTARKRDEGPLRRKRPPENDDDSDGLSRRALWSGSISFGLLQIPVSLFTAEQSRDIAFHQVDRRDNAPIRYQRVNGETGEPVEWADIARGYEWEPGHFVIIENDELSAANVKATQTIDLVDFVEMAAIAPLFFERPYYLAPGKRADKAYTLFRDALARKGVAAIGTVVIRTRQHLCAIFPQGPVLILELLRFAHDLRGTEGVPLPKESAAQVTPRELSMAEALIESMRSDWDPQKYRDTYHDDVLRLIESKAKTGTIQRALAPSEPPPNVIDIMDLLRKSVEAKRKASEKQLPRHPQNNQETEEGPRVIEPRASTASGDGPRRRGPVAAKRRSRRSGMSAA